jgi:soluble lytic murein transglycosylase-like protein
MKLKLFISFILGSVLVLLLNITIDTFKDTDPYIGDMPEDQIVNSSPSIQMYFYIKKYANQYGIPESYAFACAYHETRYGGPLDLDYNHKKESSAGAVGPMQIITRYAHKFAGRHVSESELKSNIKLNVEVSMKMLKKWYSMYHDWELAFGAYNTGHPVRNNYAKSIVKEQYTWDK